MSPRIVLFGAAGQVGSDVTSQAQQRNITVTGYTHARVDIVDKNSVRAVIGSEKPDIVINAAAYTRVDDAEDNRELAYQVNESGSRVLAEVCRDIDIPLIHISTDYVFDGTATQAYQEDDKVNPLSVYGASKLAGEEAIRSLHDKHIILRTSWVFGNYGANFVYTIARLAASRESLAVVADQTGGPTAAASIATTVLDLAQTVCAKDTVEWGTYHYSGAPATNWHAFASAIVEQLKSQGRSIACQSINPLKTAEYPVKATRPQNSVLNCDKIRKVFGIEQPDWRRDLQLVMSSPEFSRRLSEMIESANR